MANIIKVPNSNFWTNGVDDLTGESVNFEEVTTWWDGTPMDDSKADGVIYRKLPSSIGGGYVKRVWNGAIKSSWLNLDKSGLTDVTDVINQYVSIADLELEEGTYLGNFTVSGNTLIGNSKVTLKSLPINDRRVVLVSNGGKVKGVNIDGDGFAGTGIYIGETGENKCTIEDVDVSNIYGTASQGVGIRIDVTSSTKQVSIRNCSFNNIHADPNTIIGDSRGAARGILVMGDGANVTIDNCVFEDVGTFEDGDQVCVQTGASPDLVWAMCNVTINNCLFKDIYKRGVKIQASGVTVTNSKFYSSYVGEMDCAQEAVFMAGSHNKFDNNQIEFERAFHGINISGNYNIVSHNYVNIDPNYLYSSARGNNITDAITISGKGNLIADNLFLKANTFAITTTNCENSTIAGNNIYGGIRVRFSTTHLVARDNVITRRDEATGFTYAFQLEALASNTDLVIYNNILKLHTYGFTLGSGSNTDICTRWNIFNNKNIQLVNEMYLNRAEAISQTKLGGEVEDFGYSHKNVYSGSVSPAVSDIGPDEVSIFGSALPEVPPTNLFPSGSRQWRVTTQRLYMNNSLVNYFMQTAVAVTGTLAENYGVITCQRYFNGTVWGDWQRVLTTIDEIGSQELTSGLNLPMAGNSLPRRYRTIDSDTSTNLSNVSEGRILYLRVSNVDSNPHTFTFTGPGVFIHQTFNIPANSNRDFILVSMGVGNTIVHQLPVAMPSLPTSASMADLIGALKDSGLMET